MRLHSYRKNLFVLACCFVLFALGRTVRAQEPVREPFGAERVLDKTLLNDVETDLQARPRAEKLVSTSAEMQELYAKFTRLLTGAKMRGQFTVDGKPLDRLTEETYEIQKVEKQEEGDYWVITARIKYGKHDRVVPVPVKVKWAGTTPVITLDDLTIPGFGTFGARVVFHKDKYAGTWQHDDVGGHMFGMVQLGGQSDSETAPATDSEK